MTKVRGFQSTTTGGTTKFCRHKHLLMVLLLLVPILPNNRSSSRPQYYPHWNPKHEQRRVMRPPPPSSSSHTGGGTVILHPVPSLPPHHHLHHPMMMMSHPLPQTFEPHSSPFISSSNSMMMTPSKRKCDGKKNILNDIGILSLITAVMSSSFGWYTIFVNAITSNKLSIASVLLSLVLWVPSTLLALLNKHGSWVFMISNSVNRLNMVNALFNLVAIVFGTLDVLTSSAGEIVGIISLLLSIVATFPDYLDSLIENLYRVGNRARLEHFVENYGCSIPSIFSVAAGKPLYDILDRWLVDSVKVKLNAIRATNYYNY